MTTTRAAVNAGVLNKAVDPIIFEILSHRLHQITKEMGITLERVGGTVNTTQMHDYLAALYRPNGDILCAGEGMAFHVACAGFAVKHIIKRFAEEEGIHPGDVFMLNDPYVAAIHQSDVYVIAPIHYQDALVGWSATFVHVMDIGAMSPGGNSPGAREICHEGIRIAGIKLMERGKLRRDVFEAITNMTRQPEMVALDLRCEIAANNVARARMIELCDQYGRDLVDKVSGEMLRYSELTLRQRLREIPDGKWVATQSVRSDETWTVTLTMTKTGDSLLFDFTGTDPQASVGVNLPFHATFGTCYFALQQTLGHDVPKNHGAFGPIEVIAPPGTVVHPVPPAPVSLNTTSGGAVVRYLANTVMAQMVATSERWRNDAMAQALGTRFARHAGVSQHERYYVSTLLSLGGEGATRDHDGVNSSIMGGVMSCHNVEWVEMNFPLIHLYHRHIKDAAGAGRFRGGVGDEMAFVLHDAPQGRIKAVALGVAGLRNGGDGLFGGYPSAPSLLIHRTGTRLRSLLASGRVPSGSSDVGGEERLLPYCEIELGPDDVLVMTNGGGGGYGDPLERDPKRVLNDVLDNLVSPEAAQAVYGVILSDGAVDADATARVRERLRDERVGRRDGGKTRPMQPPHRSRDRHADVGRPLRENLEVVARDGGEWLRCASCSAWLCEQSEDWKKASARTFGAPTKAGPLMQALQGKYMLTHWSCPRCNALFETQMLPVEEVGRDAAAE